MNIAAGLLIGLIVVSVVIGIGLSIISPLESQQFNESINYPPGFTEPWIPLALLVLGSAIGGALVVLLRPCKGVIPRDMSV